MSPSWAASGGSLSILHLAAEREGERLGGWLCSGHPSGDLGFLTSQLLSPPCPPSLDLGGSAQLLFPHGTSVCSSLKMGVALLTCLTGVSLNYCLWLGFESPR